MITVFTRTTCAYCKTVKMFLKNKGKAFEEVNLDDHPERLAEMMKISGVMTVPVTISGNRAVVGPRFGELAAL